MIVDFFGFGNGLSQALYLMYLGLVRPTKEHDSYDKLTTAKNKNKIKGFKFCHFLLVECSKFMYQLIKLKKKTIEIHATTIMNKTLLQNYIFDS